MGSPECRWHASHETWRYRRYGVVDHHRTVEFDRKTGSEQSRQMHWFLEGAAALCGCGESKQVSDRSRTKDRYPELAYVLM